ncbi:MBL fold metallo-hydrolase [Sandarakinorhabdus sp.]|uniref:MBL fold metallo-hydrolase n=1 Tax=Sandarakinorhabdus sp. TaxID=1916663 RepID=UPI00286E8B41|nr:MBL fold metallo-hydrolase [Sandarakinorhabdus sp.]
MKITMLGSGTSSGVPRLGGMDGAGDWGHCDPADPRNRRRRVSCLVQHGDTNILVDTGPDLREQLLGARISRLDAVFLTHDHADHSHGIDDLRQIFHAQGSTVACYASPATWRVLRSRFDYVFEGTRFYPATCTATDLHGPMRVGDVLVTPFPQLHGNIESTGYRFDCHGKSAAYSTDVKGFDNRADAALSGLDLWIVDALRRDPHPTHSHLAQTLDWIGHWQPELAVLTHMDQTMDWAEVSAQLPDGVMPGHDGLVIDL